MAMDCFGSRDSFPDDISSNKIPLEEDQAHITTVPLL